MSAVLYGFVPMRAPLLLSAALARAPACPPASCAFVEQSLSVHIDQMKKRCEEVHGLANTHSHEFLPVGTAYLEAEEAGKA